MNRLQQANTAAVAPNRGGYGDKAGCELRKSSKSLRQLIDERLQAQKTTPMPKVTVPRKTAKTDSTMLTPHPPVSRPVVSSSKKSARMQRRQQARQRDASLSPSCSSSSQIQRRQCAQQRNASPSPSCSSTSAISYPLKAVAPSDNHSHSASATVCSSTCSVSSCSIGTSIRVLAGNKRQQKDSMTNQSAPEHRKMATSRVGKHLSIPTTAALHSSFSPAATVTSISVPIATAVAQSRNQNHLMSRYSSSPQKQRPQQRLPCLDPPGHGEKGHPQIAQIRKQERVFFDFEDNNIVPNPETTSTTTKSPRSHIKKHLAQDLSLKKRSDVLRKIIKSNTTQSTPLKSQELKRVEGSQPRNNRSTKIVAGGSSNNKNKSIAPDSSSNNQNKSMENGNVNMTPSVRVGSRLATTPLARSFSSNNQNNSVDNCNVNMTPDVRVGGRLSTPLARSRRFQSWSDSRKQKHAAYSSGANSLNGE
jgi:hypothetical protein